MKKRSRKAKSDDRGDERAGEEGKDNRKNKKIDENREGTRAEKTNWEFRRRKGDGLEPFRAMYQFVVKRGTS